MINEKTWYETLGLKSNPFMIKPYAFEKELSGYKKEIRKVKTSINRGRVIFIEGDYGVGKTSVLKQVIDEFGGRRKLIYYSANRSEGGIDWNALVRGRAGPIGRLFGVMPKDLILMIDEAQKLTFKDSLRIEELIRSRHFRSVIFVCDDINKVNLTDSLKKKIGPRILRLSDLLSEHMAVRLVKGRLGKKNQKFIPPKIIKFVFEKAGRNPRRMLEFLEDISRYAIEEQGADRITEEHVIYVLA